MKIWYQKMTPTKNPVYLELLEANLNRVKRKDTEIHIRIPRVGLTKHEYIPYGLFRFLNEREILAGVLQSQEENYDGSIIASFRDSCPQEARETLTTPVIGPAESSMLLAHPMGSRFAIISIHPKSALGVEGLIDRYGFRKRTIPHAVRSMTLSLQEQVEGLKNAGKVIEDFSRVAKRAILDGAEVLICGCCMISPILEQAGVKELDRVPIVNCVTASVKVAELLIDLKALGIPWISRKNSYAPPPHPYFDEVKNLFPYLGSRSE
jgi:Asp/Glu/hydantoin racemase